MKCCYKVDTYTIFANRKKAILELIKAVSKEESE